MGNFNRKKRSNKSAVSEIIGNILILGITVTLFSSIMYFVVSMPAPHQTGYADMQPQTVNYGADYRTAYLNITNKGGQPLDDSSTGIYIFVNDTINQSLKIHDGGMPIGSQWTTGKTWNYILHFTPPQNATKARISISIIDTAKNVEIYNGILTGGNILGNSPPVIGARGTSPSPNYPQTIFFADVTDPDGDLITWSVYLDASALGTGFSQPIKMTDSNNDGRFTCGPYAADPNTWNGRMVIVNATDKKNNSDTEAMTINIQTSGGGGGNQYIGPFNNYSSYFINGTYPPDANGGESGGQTGTSGTTFYYIRELANPTVITRDFTAGEGVLIEIWSDSLRNLAIENSFYLIDPLTGDHITPPTSINAFGYGGIFGTFHKYTLNFTAPTNKMVYPFTIRLRDNVGTVVSISDYINVNRATYPMLQTYKLNPDTLLLEKCGTFNHTDTVYLKIITKDTDSSIIDVLTGDIEVADYTGRYIIKKLPPAANVFPATPEYSAPLSSLFKTSAGAGSPNRIADTASSGVYTIEIVLRDAYQGWWLPRTNAYTITLSEIADVGNPGTAEDYNSLTIQLNVTAPLSTTDIVASVGSGSYTWSSSGASWSENSLVWFKGGERSDQWTKTVIDPNTKNGPIGLALTDVDGDSYKDLIVGWQDQSVSVGWYKNLKVDGSEWSTVPYIIAPAFDAHLGDDYYGSQSDRGNSNEDVTVYATRNGGFQTGLNGYHSVNEIAGAMSTGDFDGYGDQEVVVSFVHPVVYTTSYSSGGADYTNSFGMFFNRGIYVYWNIIQGGSSVTKTSLVGTLSYLSGSGDNGANGNNNPAAMDIQCADLNKDGYDDIVAVYQDGTTLAWLNQFSKLTGNTTYRMQNAFGPGSLISNIVTVPGRAPWDDPSGQNGRVAKVRLMDMNKDGYPDIVRTSTVGQGAGGADANIYVLYTKQSTNSNPQFPIVESHTYGSAMGSFADLAVVDNLFENITETTSTVPDTGNAAVASLNSADANPANPTTSAPYFTSGVYQVAKNGGALTVNGFTLNSANSGNTVASASLNMKYIVWPLPATSTQNPNAESHSYGTATGTVSNLVAVDSSYEDLNEQTLTTGTIVGNPAKHATDNTGALIANILTEDGILYYEVQKSGTSHNLMQLTFSIDPAQSGKAVNSAVLRIKYHTSSTYPGSGSSNPVQWSLDGSNWHTIFTPSQTTTDIVVVFDLKVAGVDTYAELNSLMVRFTNLASGGSSARSVFFDIMVEQATFVNGNALDWTWTINNVASYPNQDLTINAYCQDSSESYTIMYSSDNVNWVTLGLISSTTGQDYTWSLVHHSGSYYYVRVIDNNQGATDTASSTFKVNMVKIVNSGESGYAGTNTVEISFDTGLNWIDTGIRPSASDTSWVTTSVNLVTLKGSQVTYNDLVGLRVRFINNDANPSLVRSVWFDVLNEQVVFNDGERADWTWTINNDVTYANHNLTVNAFCLDSSESFTMEYSIDNVNWLGQRTISSTTAQNYTWNLPAHSGNYYYVRIVDDDKNTTDKIPSTLCLNMIKLLHYPAEVNWPISDEKIITITGIGSGEFITAIALGDIGKSYDDFKADTYPDIVVSTSKVGNGDATHTLFVIMQGGGGSGFEAPTAVDTSVVATRVGNNNAIYDTKAIELGDFNGDKNLDIVMVIGFAPGRTGSGVPSLYIYANRPDLGAATFQESAVNALDTSQSAINVKTGNIDLAILLPFLGVVGVIAGEAFVERRKRKK